MSVDKQAVLDFIEANEQAGEEGRRIKQAAKNGIVEPAFYRYESAPGESGRHRELVRDAIWEVWAYEKRPAKLREIYEKVLKLITYEAEAGKWPGIWTLHPDKRTIDRRVNEVAQPGHPEFYPTFDVPPCMCIRPGWYQPNVVLFEDSVKEAILHV